MVPRAHLAGICSSIPLPLHVRGPYDLVSAPDDAKFRVSWDRGCHCPLPGPPLSLAQRRPRLTLPSRSASGSESPKDQSTFQKLLHISATAQLEHPEYTGPLLPASDWAPWLLACDGKATPLQKELRDTLRGLLGSPSRGSFAVATQYGWVLGEALSALPRWWARGLFCPGQDLCAPGTVPSMSTRAPP